MGFSAVHEYLAKQYFSARIQDLSNTVWDLATAVTNGMKAPPESAPFYEQQQLLWAMGCWRNIDLPLLRWVLSINLPRSSEQNSLLL